MRRWLPILAVLLAAGLLLLHRRRHSPERHVEDIAYEIRCGGCSTNYTMTTAVMNRMIDRGEVVSPAEQVRRFKCRGCGQLEATLDISGYERQTITPGGQP